MNASQKYDIIARAFEIMTGLMAPGKDSPSAAGPTDMAVRTETWNDWRAFHDRIIRAMMRAFEENFNNVLLLTEIAVTAEELEGWLHRNAGMTADWPVDLVARDETASEDLCKRLNALSAALKDYHESKN